MFPETNRDRPFYFLIVPWGSFFFFLARWVFQTFFFFFRIYLQSFPVSLPPDPFFLRALNGLLSVPFCFFPNFLVFRFYFFFLRLFTVQSIPPSDPALTVFEAVFFLCLSKDSPPLRCAPPFFPLFPRVKILGSFLFGFFFFLPPKPEVFQLHPKFFPLLIPPFNQCPVRCPVVPENTFFACRHSYAPFFFFTFST